MTAPEESRTHARRLRERLREEYGDFRRRRVPRDRSPDRYETLRDRVRAEGPVGAVGAWIRDEADRVLLVRETDREGVDPGWTDPGGAVEPGESYETAAHREVREEAGVAIDVTGVLEVLSIEHCHREDPDLEPIVVPTPIFEAAYAGGEPRPQPGETDDVGWFASPPASVRYPVVRDRPFPGE